MSNKKIIYFTQSFPYGIGEMWKLDELNTIAKYFSEIVVVPNSYGGNNIPVIIDSKIKYIHPLTSNHKINKLNIFYYLFFSKYSFLFFKEFFEKKIFLKKKKFISWYKATINSIFLLTHPFIRELYMEKDEAPNLNLLFFWGKGSCEFLPFIDTKIFNKVIIKMHRYDLFEYLENNYFPYRKQLISSSTFILPSHKCGKDYLNIKYPEFVEKIIINRVGTKPSEILRKTSRVNKLVIYSCSTLTKVKRVSLMLHAASKLTIPFEWNHIGFGQLQNELEVLHTELNLGNTFRFLGFVKPQELKQYYLKSEIDLFVNTSESEGIPVSILEILSIGIPVIATDVGSVSEVIDESVGYLLTPNFQIEDLVNRIEFLYQKLKIEKFCYSENCYKKFNEIGNSDIFNQELVNLLLK